MKKLNYIDLFSGCGGLTEGFEKSGFYNPLAFVDWDYYACKTLVNRLEKKWNIKNSNQIVIHDDIRNFQRILNGFEGDNNFTKHLGLKKINRKKESRHYNWWSTLSSLFSSRKGSRPKWNEL